MLNGRTTLESSAFSRDGRLLAIGNTDGEVRVWDMETNRQYGLTLAGNPRPVTSLAFAEDGRTLYAAIRDQGVLREFPLDVNRNIDTLCSRSGHLTEAEWRTHIPEAPYRKTC
ncbi:WD40 repeat domain-containing protein [Actinomadura adrarensis]|uniref:WD40 repeat domain-containing protein n=1 Tax=Actinomadura adrarensis TaxID=1819600 RepID=A0ABW3CKD4_9ACTN